MRQKRDTDPRPIERDDEANPWADDPQSARELLELEIGMARHRGSTEVTLPLDVAEMLFTKRKRGSGKRDGHGTRVMKEGIYAWARRRRDELIEKGVRADLTDGLLDSAADQAAKEASEFAAERHSLSLSAGTISDEMHRMPGRHRKPRKKRTMAGA